MGHFLITGGAKRLGATIARSLAAADHDLVIHYRDSADLAQNLAASLPGDPRIIQGDLINSDSTRAFLESYKALNLRTEGLIYNVGPYLQKTLLATTETEWRTLFELSVHAPLALARALVPDLMKSKGSIIMMGMAGLGRADPKRAAYKIAKSTLYSITRDLAKELAPQGVTVNMVSPGYLENSIEIPEKFSTYSSGSLVTCDEICQAIHFLIKNRQITGQNLEVAGGIGL